MCVQLILLHILLRRFGRKLNKSIKTALQKKKKDLNQLQPPAISHYHQTVFLVVGGDMQMSTSHLSPNLSQPLKGEKPMFLQHWMAQERTAALTVARLVVAEILRCDMKTNLSHFIPPQECR